MDDRNKESLLVSACLLGRSVRYDGGHAQVSDNELLAQLRTKFKVIPICPEMLGGLPTPRPAAEIKHRDNNIEVVDCNGNSYTNAFFEGASKTCKIAVQYKISRALLKSNSPSCGRDLVYDGSFTGQLQPGNGITVQQLQALGIKVYHEDEIEALLANNELS